MDVSEEIYKEMNQTFDAKIKELFLQKKNQLLTKKVYNETLTKLKTAKANNIPKVQIKHRYDIITLDGIERLIVPIKEDNPVIKYFVHMEEMFRILYDTHLQHGHCGRNRMEKEINLKFKNITREIVKAFLELCYICQQKRPVPVKQEKEKVQPSSFEVKFQRCQVNVIDMQANPDGPYKYMLIYEDHRTKLVQLRPLKTCGIQEIAGAVLKIFTIFGAPSIMDSENGREFARDIINELSKRWSELKMVHGQYQASSLNIEVMELLGMWMEKNRVNQWSKCLRYVQLMKNGCYNKALDCTPHEAMFGVKCMVGIPNELIPSSVMNTISSEEDLELYVKKSGVSKIKMEEGTNINIDAGSTESFEDFLMTLKREHESEDEGSVVSVDLCETDMMPQPKIMRLEAQM